MGSDPAVACSWSNRAPSWPSCILSPIRALWGVGPATGRRLEGIGVRTIGDLAALPVGTLERLLGAAQGDSSGCLGSRS